MSRRWFFGSWIAIVLFAAVLRLWHLGSLPVSLYWDEAAMLVDIKSVTQTGKDMHGRPWYQVIYPSYGDYKLPMYIWSATAAAKIFGVNEFSLRLPNALAGVLTVIVAGWLARVLLQVATQTKYSQKTLDQLQLWVMLIVAITPWSIMFSRTAFEGHLGQALLATSIAILAWSLWRSQRVLFWLSPFIGAAATYSYFSVRFVWPVVYMAIATLVIGQIFRRELLNKNSKLVEAKKTLLMNVLQAFAGLVLFMALILPVIFSPLAKETDALRLSTNSVLNNDAVVIESNLYRELAGNTIIDRVLYHRALLYGRELAKNYADNLSIPFLFLTGDPNLRHGTTQHGVFLFVLVIGFVGGAAFFGKRHFPLLAVFMLWWIVALLPASIPEETPHALRSLNALAPLSIIIGVGCWWLQSQNIQNSWKFFKKTPVLQLIIATLLTLNFLHFWFFYSSVYPKLSANDWQSGYAPLAKSIVERSAQTEVWVTPPDDRFYLWVMAYGPFTGDDFQSWKTIDYKFVTGTTTHIPGIHFTIPERPELLSLLAAKSTITLAGRAEVIEKLCQPNLDYDCTISAINDEVGNPKFSMATLQRSYE